MWALLFVVKITVSATDNVKFSAGIFLIYLVSNNYFQHQSVKNTPQKGNSFLAVLFEGNLGSKKS